MANFYRLIVAALLFVASSAFGAPVPKSVGYQGQYEGSWRATRDTPQAACSVVVGVIMSNPGNTAGGLSYSVGSGTADHVCHVRRSDGAALYYDIRKVEACPQGYTENASGMCDPPPTQCEGGRERDASGQCVCKAGTKEPPGGVGMCVPDGTEGTDDRKCEVASALFNTVGTDRLGRISGKHPLGQEVEVCADSGQIGGSGQPLGCRHKFVADVAFEGANGWVSEGQSFGMTTGAGGPGSGLACALGIEKDPNKPEDAEKVPEAKKPDEKCRNGYSGMVNGVSVCIDRASGQQTGVDWNRITDGAGQQTDLKTEVSCNGDKCVVTQTKTPVGGGTSSTSTTNVDRTQFCRSNPKHPVCGNVPTGGNTGGSGATGGGGGGSGSGGGGNGNGDGDGDGEKGSFGGSCGAGFTCEGDAIQCAIAREQHVRACKLFDDKSPESELYAAEVAKGTQRNVTGDLPGNETVDVASKLNTGNLLGTAQCPGDLNVTVWRTEVALPFSRLCQPLDYMGWILVAVAGIAGFRIVSGTSKES